MKILPTLLLLLIFSQSFGQRISKDFISPITGIRSINTTNVKIKGTNGLDVQVHGSIQMSDVDTSYYLSFTLVASPLITMIDSNSDTASKAILLVGGGQKTLGKFNATVTGTIEGIMHTVYVYEFSKHDIKLIADNYATNVLIRAPKNVFIEFQIIDRHWQNLFKVCKLLLKQGEPTDTK